MKYIYQPWSLNILEKKMGKGEGVVEMVLL
jgi:hypothetical protein